MVIFINEILVNSQNEIEHEHHLKLVLVVLRNHNLYTIFSKYHFLKNEVTFLGHVVLAAGIYINPDIKEWK